MKKNQYFLEKNDEISNLNLILSKKIRKRVRIAVVSSHFGLLIILVLWYFISRMQVHKEQVIKVKLFQTPVSSPKSENKKSGKTASSSIKKAEPKKKERSKKSINKPKRTKKKSVKKKKVVKKKAVKVKKQKSIKRPEKSISKKKKKTTRKFVPIKKSKSQKKKNRKQYLRPEDIVISHKVISSEPERVVTKVNLPSVSEQDMQKNFLKNIESPKGSYSVSSKRRGGNISASYFNRVSEYIYGIWKQPTKAETGNRQQKVEIKVTVDSFGRVVSARVVKKSMNSAMNRSIDELLRNMKTLPVPPKGKSTFSIELEVK